MRIGGDSKIIYGDLCYRLYGLLYYIHNELGRYCSEKQYADAFEIVLKENKINYIREAELKIDFEKHNIKRNRVDFIVFDKILIDFKAKPIITKEDFFQAQRYLKSSKLKLLLIVNFREKYIRPKRVLNAQAKVDTALNLKPLYQ